MKMPPLNVVFATDGNAGTLLGIAMVITQLPSSQLFGFEKKRYYVVCPDSSQKQVAHQLQKLFPELEFAVLPAAQRPEDPYYVQVGISNAFEAMNSDEYAIALDYDHIILSHTKLRKPTPGQIFVSSEVYSAIPTFDGVEKPGWLSSTHINCSMIFGRADDLVVLTKQWSEAYQMLVNIVPIRCRTEVAFGLAGQAVGLKVVPCDVSFQCSLNNFVSDTMFLHFGGSSQVSKKCKNALSDLACSDTAPMVAHKTIRNLILENFADRSAKIRFRF